MPVSCLTSNSPQCQNYLHQCGFQAKLLAFPGDSVETLRPLVDDELDDACSMEGSAEIPAVAITMMRMICKSNPNALRMIPMSPMANDALVLPPEKPRRLAARAFESPMIAQMRPGMQNLRTPVMRLASERPNPAPSARAGAGPPGAA